MAMAYEFAKQKKAKSENDSPDQEEPTQKNK